METFIHKTAEVSEKAVIGEGTKVWNHAQVRENARTGKNCILGKNAYIDAGVQVGNRVKIQNNACIYNAVIEDDAFIGPGVLFTNDLYPRAFIWNKEKVGEKIVVRKGASLGVGSIVLCGVEIGEYAMTGAGSIVTKNVPPHALVFGNPAKIHGFVCKCGVKVFEKHAKEVKGKIHFKCAQCGEEFDIQKSVFEEFRKQRP
jgi:acetyltransferase-like isoleucine patch superfamily enzyme